METGVYPVAGTGSLLGFYGVTSTGSLRGSADSAAENYSKVETHLTPYFYWVSTGSVLGPY